MPRHLVVDPGQDLHEVQFSLEALQRLTQRLDEPGAVVGVPPGVVACRSISLSFQAESRTLNRELNRVTWSRGVRIQEVCLHGNLVRCLLLHSVGLDRHPSIQVRPTTCLTSAAESSEPTLFWTVQQCVSGPTRTTNLDEEELWFPHQTQTFVPFEISDEGVDVFKAVGAIYDPLLSMAEQHTHEGRTLTVVLLRNWTHSGTTGQVSRHEM